LCVIAVVYAVSAPWRPDIASNLSEKVLNHKQLEGRLYFGKV
jgi:hypothetical protein